MSLLAAIRDTKDLSLANIIGSNIANIGLVVGVCAVIRPLKIEQSMLRYEVPIMILGTLVFSWMSWDGLISQRDGVILLIGFLIFLFIMIKASKKDRSKAKLDSAFVDIRKQPGQVMKQLLFILLGLAGLIGGSYLIVQSAEFIAAYFGVSAFIIGISVVAIGTSLPELAISAVGAIRGSADLAVGNAVGSNIFNTLFVIAIVSVLLPIPVDRSLFTLHYPFMLAFTIISFPMMRSKFRLSRWEGVLLLLGYVIFMVSNF